MEEESSPPMENSGLESKPKSKSELKSKLAKKLKSKLEKNSKSKLEKNSKSKSSSSAWTEQLRKLVELVKQEVENKPGAYLWRERRVEKAMKKKVTDNDLEYNTRRLHILQKHVKSRIWWLNMVENSNLLQSFSTGWDLNRVWRLWHAIGSNRKGLKGLEFDQEFISRGLITSVLEYMKNHWPEEDKDLTVEEITHNFHLLNQILEHSREKKRLTAALQRTNSHHLSSCSPKKKMFVSLRVKLLKKKNPFPPTPNDNGDNAVVFKDDAPIHSLREEWINW